MNQLFDLLFNSNNYIKDNIILNEINVHIARVVFTFMEVNQGYIVERYGELKTNNAKKALKDYIDKGYIELCKAEENLKKAEKDLEEVKQNAKKLL